jgi:hypothetical protein
VVENAGFGLSPTAIEDAAYLAVSERKGKRRKDQRKAGLDDS